MKKRSIWIWTIVAIVAIVACGLWLRFYNEAFSLTRFKAYRQMCPPTIYFQPYGTFSQSEAEKLGDEMVAHLNEMFEMEVKFKVLPNRVLADSLLNDARTRFRADKICHSLSTEADCNNIYIGLTKLDISTSVHGKKDYGVLGLSQLQEKTCVVSTYRVKRMQDLWKVACHEFIHAYFDYHHCPKDDPTCIMQQAKGRPDFRNKEGLCAYCQSILSNKPF